MKSFICQVSHLVDNKIVSFNISVDEKNYQEVYYLLSRERRNFIEILKGYKKKGIIKTICKPKNKKMKEHLSELVAAKQKIIDAMFKITTYF